MTLIMTNDNFEEIVKEGVTLIDFWAEWCGPCQMMLPLIDQFADKMKDKAKVAKVNVDENQELARQFRIMSIPTLLIFKDGELVETLVGVQDMIRLDEAVGKYL